MAREHLNFTIWNPWPVDKDPVTADGVGTWPADTYSFFVAAWYYDDVGEADKDNAGWSLGIEANWNNVVVGANEIVHINWTQAARRPVRYSVYCQVGASFNRGLSADRVAVVDGSLTSVDIVNPSFDDTMIFGARNEFDVAPIIQMDPLFREIQRSYDGTILNPSYEPETAITELMLTLSTVSMTRAEYRQLMKCIERGYRIYIADPTAGSEDDPFYFSYLGQFVATDHLLSTQKNRRSELLLRFMVELAEEIAIK